MTEPKVFYRTQSTVCGAATERGPSVPYGAVTHDDGEQNYGFVDLRARPDLIPAIEEAKDSSGLQEVLTVLNQGPFRSLGCAKGIFPREETNKESGGPVCSMNCYIDMTFIEPHNDETAERLLRFAINLADKIGDVRHLWTSFEIETQRGFLFGAPAAMLMIRACAHVPDEKYAKSSFERAVRLLAVAIGSLSATA